MSNKCGVFHWFFHRGDRNARSRRRNGIVLPIALSLTFALLIFALAVAQQSELQMRFSVIMEAREREQAAATAMLADLQSALQYDSTNFTGDLNPDALCFAIPINCGGVFQSLFSNGDDINIATTGEFNGAAPFASMLEAVPSSPSATVIDGYAGGALTNSGLWCPARHAVLYATASMASQSPSTWLGVYDANFPFGVIACNGSVTLMDACSVVSATPSEVVSGTGSWSAGSAVLTFSSTQAPCVGMPVSTPGSSGLAPGTCILAIPASGQATLSRTATGSGSGTITFSNDSGLPCNVYGASGVTLSGSSTASLVNARLYTAPNSSPPTASAGGAVLTGTTSMATLPPDFLATLSNARSALNGLSLTDLSTPVSHLEQFAQQNYQVLSAGGPLSVAQQSGGPILELPGNFVLPAGDSSGSSSSTTGSSQSAGVTIPLDAEVTGNLIIGANQTLHVRGSLAVSNNVYLGTGSSLVVDDRLNVAGAVDSTSTGGLAPPITSGIIAGNDVTIGQGTGSTVAPVITPAPSPGPFSVVPVNAAVQQTVNTDFGTWFPNATTPSSVATPVGVFIYTDGHLSLTGAQATGLFVSAHDMTINPASSGGTCRVTGTLWCENGNITATACQFRNYPYCRHAWIQAASSQFAVGATRWWQTAWGRVQ